MTTSKGIVSWLRVLLAASALAISASAMSQPYGYGYGQGMMGPGMMGPGMMGPGMMGPGMMGPGMMGPGMMGPGMMGPGMMGPGMMGGYCPGCGMGSGAMYDWIPDLSDAQRKQIGKVQQELFTKQTELGLKLNEERGRLQSMWYADKRDPAQIREQTRKIYDLQHQMTDSARDAQLKMEELLTPEQRERTWRQGGWGGWR